jgi:hypothetical protein
MKKGTFIDYAVIMAARSNRKKRRNEKLNRLTTKAAEAVNSIGNKQSAKAVAA